MAKNRNSVHPDFLQIPSPRFNLGQYVQWSLEFDNRVIKYYGIVQGITWFRDKDDDFGGWSFWCKCLKVFSKGELKQSNDYDDVPESDLKPWIGDGIDKKIDTGIDTDIVPPTTNKALKASLL